MLYARKTYAAYLLLMFHILNDQGFPNTIQNVFLRKKLLHKISCCTVAVEKKSFRGPVFKKPYSRFFSSCAILYLE